MTYLDTRRIAAAFMAVIMALAGVSVSAQTDERMLEEVFSQNLEQGFAEADGARDPVAWIRCAQGGLEAAVAGWEAAALAVYEGGPSFEGDKDRIQRLGQEELDRRFASWLMDRFFGGEAAKLRASVASAAERESRRRLYVTDESSELCLAPNGDPIIQRPQGSIEAEGQAWQSALNAYAKDATDSFLAAINGLGQDALIRLAPGERERFRDIFAKSSLRESERCGTLVQELMRREESLFVARLGSDRWSLRSQSEGESADNALLEACEEAEAACDAGLSALALRIEEAQAGAGDLALEGADWLEQFQEQFERGLDAWERAEERFMTRRLEWEASAASAFDAGMTAWADAYDRLEMASQAWEEQASALLVTGEAAFKEASVALADDIEKARALFEFSAAQRQSSGSEKAAALVDIYVQSARSMSSAEEGAKYWLGILFDRVGMDDPPEFGSQELDTFLELRKILLSTPVYAADAYDAQREALEESERWLGMYRDFRNRCTEARNSLENEYTLALGGETLGAVLSDGTGPGEFCLDEYQVALLKARAVRAYWDRRASMAELVQAYAEDLSSGRATEAESDDALAAAGIEYASALDAYRQAVGAVTDAGSAIQDSRSALASALDELDRAGSALEALNREYSRALAAIALGGAGYLRDEAEALYQAMAELETEEVAEKEADKLAVFLAAGSAYGVGATLESASVAFEYLVRGRSGEPSLAELDAAWRKVWDPSGSDVPDHVDQFGLSTEDPEYHVLARMLKGLETADPADGAYLKAAEDAIRAVVRTAAARKNAALKQRLDGLALIAAADLRAWYAERAGRSLPEDIETALAGDLERAERELLKRRLELELGALKQDGSSSLDAFWAGNPEDRERALAVLESLTQGLEGHWDDGAGAFDTVLAGLCAAEEGVELFIMGQGFYSVDGLDLGTCFANEELTGCLQANGRYGAYHEWAAYAPAVEAEHRRMALSIMSDALSDLGMSSPDEALGELGLPGAAALSAALNSEPEMAIEKTLDLMIAGQGARSLAPGWMSGVLDSWVAAVAESAASWALASGVGLVSVAQADSGIRDVRLALDQALAGANPDMELEPLARALARAQALRVLAITAERIETARAEAEEDGTLHWRQGLCSPCLDASDDDAGEQESAPALVGSSSWIEGYALDAADALDMAARAAGGAVRQWRDEDFIAGVRTDTALEASYQHLLAGIASYLTDPSAAYSSAYAIVLPSRLDDAFTAASGEWNSVLAGKARLRASFANAVNDWALACDPVALKDALPSMEICLNAARDSYELARTLWEQATSSFTAAGAAYETARQAAASLYTGLEDARFELEARKALQRWASTAYLSSEGERGVAVYRDPAAELAWCRDRLARSAAAVDVLAGLYAGDLSERPYDDPEYQAALAEFKARQTDAMLMAKAEATLSKTWTALSAERASALRAYWDIINGGESGMPFAQELPFEDYQALDTLSTAGWNDVLTVGADGRLALSRDADNRLVLNDADGARILADYFKPTEDGGPSRFQEALGNFSARIASYNLDGEQLYSWGLARDYLLSSVLRANPDAAVLSQDGPVSDSRLHDAMNAVSVYYEPASNMLDEFRAQGLDVLRRRAWDKLGQEQKADLEMLLTLELSGSCQVAPLLNAIKDATRAAEYRYMEARFDHLIDQVSFILWPPNLVRYLYWKDARDSILSGPCDGFTREMDQGAKALNARASEMAKAWNRIQGVEKQLAALSLDGAGDVGDHIARAVKAAGGWSDEDVAGLKSACARQQAAIQEGSSLPELVAGMSEGCSQAAADATKNLEAVHSRKRADSNQLVADFQACYDGYMSGDTDEGAFRAAAALAYGAGSPSWSSHLRSLGAWTLDGLLSSPDTDPEFLEKAARSMVSLIERAWAERVAGERAVLADEYSLAFEDLAERWNAWNTAAGLILSRGRADFMQARSDMAERAEAWAAAFDKSYREKTLAWNAAALDAADSKLAWAGRAALAADSAAKGGMLSLVGEDAEHGARALDLNQVGELRLACDPDGLLEKALASAGISGMAKALAWSGTAGQTTGVRTDDGFASSWDSAAIQASARSYAEDSRQRLSTGQAKLMARSARDAVDLAVRGLEDSVRQANFQFEDSMDELFMRQGGWSRYGRLYVKDVLSHSTLFDYAITERASVDTYREYRMDAWRPSTDLSDEASAGLDGAGLQELVRQAQEEVEKRAGAVFGTEDDETEDAIASRTRLFRFYREERYVSGMETITVEDRNGDLRTIERPVYSTRVLEDEGKLQKRTTGAGLFGAWLGYDPVLSDLPDVDEGLDDTFRDQGSGELGRLMSQYLYWSLKEGKGLGELAKPMYEKDLWDDRGSWLQAPNLRGIADIGVTIGAAVLSGGTSLGAMLVSAGINLADDAVFGALDVATGYKTWEEAGLEFGKKAVSSAMGAVVGSTGGLSSLVDPSLGFGHVLASTMLDGVQTVGMSLATSAINAVQWDGSGLVWSSDMFSAGVTGGLSGALAGAAGGITGGVMNLGLEGFVSDLASDARTLSAVLGGLAEQGVSYAMGGTASFNLFNLGVFGWKGEDGNAIRTGLLELSIGGDGIGLGLGQGGMDMSLGTIASALRGTEAWLVNARMAFSGQDEAGKYASALRSLYSAGKASGPDRTRFEQIISGKANILEDAEGAFSALTKYDTTNDTYTITLGKNVLEDSSRFGLNIVLAHEARRNGLNDGEDGQTKETQDAVIGHIELAAALGDTYGMNALTERQRAEVTALNEARKGYVAGMLDVFASYASEDDYWRLTVDGNLMYDGFKELRREFYLANGEVGVEFVEGSQEETTRGGALVHYLGEGRARTLLGGSAESLGTYDLESLKSVMPSLTQESLSALKDNGGTLADLNLTQAQKDQLLGESLMRKYGMAFDQDKGWSGKETVSFSLTDEDVGMIGIARVGANQYERFTVSMIVRRHPDAFDTWKDGSATNDYNVRDNSDIAFYKWALPGERLANGQEFERYAPQFQFTSIANTLGGENDRIWEVSIEDKDKVPHTYLSNTLASGTFNMRLIPSTSGKYGVDTVGLLSNAITLAGEQIGLDGRVKPEDKLWLFHNFGISAGSLGCIGPMSDDINYNCIESWKRVDKPGSGAWKLQRILDKLRAWNVYDGLLISGIITGRVNP